MSSKREYYNKIDANPNFSSLELEVQDFWRKNNIFQASIDQYKDTKKNFVFYDGPPFANGLPHYGHLLTGFVKDIFARYQTQLGNKTERRFGWDTHGLPVEMETEKELGVSGRVAIEEFGINKFNDACSNSVMKYQHEWKDYVDRQGRWVDFDNGYKTMDLDYMESVIWAFKELYKKGYLYEDLRVMPYSWACQTPLSNFETRLDNSYREKESKAITVKFRLRNYEHSFSSNNLSILVWTTTPWTLPSNLALAINNDIKYSLIDHDNEQFLIASSLIDKYRDYLSLDNNINIVREVSGKDLVGLEYEPIFDYFINNSKENLDNCYKIYHADFVNISDGTGVVHIAPAFGEDDQLLCKENNIVTICPVDEAGKFTYPIEDFIGLHVFDANIPIIKKLKESGNWVKTEQYIHNYPHCWRSDQPLIYKAMSSWYVSVTKFKSRMIELNEEINWIPNHVKEGLFGKWLEGARDWSISRNRFWGCPVPVWKSTDPKYPRIDVYGSIAELEEDFDVKIDNLHRPFIDKLTRVNPDDPTGKSMMVRVTDVLDCWFESGSMPFAQQHYPFENKDKFINNFPADFIVEYVAQTRGWFYTLMVLSTALFDRPPFKNCICHGVILDEKSQKLSKRLKNYKSPLEIFDNYGSDAMRFSICSSPVMKGSELNIDKDGHVFRDSLRLYIKPIWNSFNFFILYANSDGIKAKLDFTSENVIDQYILSKLKSSIISIRNVLDNYDLAAAYNVITDFFEILNNWYIRRNRDRFWKSEIDNDKVTAYNTLYSVLHVFMRSIASLLPHISDYIFRILENNDNISVHLEKYPVLDKFIDNQDLVNNMDMVRDICNNAHSLRSANNVRTRQPLNKVIIVGKKYSQLSEFTKLICDEINVKEIEFISNIAELADYKVNLNFKLLGVRLGAKIKEVTKGIKQNNWKIESGKLFVSNEIIEANEFDLKLVPKMENFQSLSSLDGLVGLDVNLDDDLIIEGIARDLVRIIQQERKDKDLNINDRVNILIKSENNLISEVIKKFRSYISEQTLTDKLFFENVSSGSNVKIANEGISVEIIK